MDQTKKSPQVATTTSEEKDAWYFRENKFFDLALPVISLIVSIVVLIITLSN